MMRVLLMIALAFACCLSKASATKYQPAVGYFVCQDASKTCTLQGCSDCSIVNNGFTESSLDGNTVFTSSAGSNVAVAGGDDSSSMECDDSCECQSLVENVGCTLADGESRSEADSGKDESNVNLSVEDNSSGVALKLSGVVLSAFVAFLL